MPKKKTIEPIKSHFDSPTRKISISFSGEIKISGWCFRKDSGRSVDRVFLRVGSRIVDCIPVNRPDAAEETSIDDIGVGFEVTLLQLKFGRTRIEVFAEHAGKETLLNQFWLISIPTPPLLKTKAIKAHFEAPKVQFFQRIKGRINIAGYCYDSSNRKALDRIFLKIGDRLVACEKIDRDDVQFLGKERSPLIGFTASFSTGIGLKLIEVFTESDGRRIRLKRFLFWVRRDDNFLNTDSYKHWIDHIEPVGKKLLHRRASKFLGDATKHPCFALISPCYNTPPKLLDELVLSIRGQSYSNWKLYLVNDKSSHPETIERLKHHEASDPRIQLIESSHNGNISHATNLGILESKEEWVFFIDHDDRLSPDALLHFAVEIYEYPTAKLIYSDEDKLDSGERIEPHFKPDWNPTLLQAQNYICHLVALKRDLIDSVGLFDSQYDGAQDHDYLLRCSEKVTDEQVRHIPWICYHWQKAQGSTAASTEAKPASLERGLAAVDAHLKRLEPKAFASEGRFPHTYRAHWPIKHEQPSVELIIPTRNGGTMMRKCVQSLIETANYRTLSITIVDNQSDDHKTLQLLEGLAQEPNIRVLKYDREFNYSAINNWAAAQSCADFIALVNDDIESTQEGWLQEMLGHALRPGAGAVGAKLHYPDFRQGIQHAGVIVGLGGVAGHGHKYFPRHAAGYHRRLLVAHEVTAVTAACLLVKRENFLEVGGLNENDLKVAFNDVDLCLRLHKAGFHNIWTPHAQFLHHESASRGTEDTPEKKLRFQKEAIYMLEEHNLKTFVDPHYSPHLTLDSEDFSLATRPHPIFLDPDEIKPAEFEKTEAQIQQIILHVGRHKTGTSSVQFYLAENSELLMKHGYLYPETLGVNHSFILKDLFSPKPGRWSYKTRKQRTRTELEQEKKDILRQLKEEITRSQCHSLILSGEEISHLDKESLQRMKRTLQDLAPRASFKILCILREPVAYATSAIQEILKAGHYGYESAVARGSELGSKNREILQNLIDVFRRPQLTVDTYESLTSHKNGLVTGILEKMGLPPHLQAIGSRNKKINISISQNALDLIKFISEKEPLMETDGELNPKRRRNDLVPLRRIPGAKFLLPPKISKKIRRGAAKDLNWVQNNFDVYFKMPDSFEAPAPVQFNEAYAHTFISIIPELTPNILKITQLYFKEQAESSQENAKNEHLQSILGAIGEAITGTNQGIEEKP